VDELRRRSLTYKVPTLHIFGDSHRFTIDQPYKIDNKTIEHIVRLQVFGFFDRDNLFDPQIKWVRVNVDTETDEVFSFDVCNSDTGICTPQ